jgi:hypothetical protein
MEHTKFIKRLHISISVKFYYRVLKSCDYADCDKLLSSYVFLFEVTRDEKIKKCGMFSFHGYVKATAHNLLTPVSCLNYPLRVSVH